MSSAAPARLRPGTALPELRRTVPQEQINAYAEASGDFNPIHVDEEFARSVGLPGTIAHGLLEMGILAEAVAGWAGGSTAVRSLEVRFSKPLRAGDTIICTGTVIAVDEAGGVATLEVEASSDRGERVLTNGRATVRLQQ